eukprot:365243-Chlamydomonas_euryale.AAC.17
MHVSSDAGQVRGTCGGQEWHGKPIWVFEPSNAPLTPDPPPHATVTGLTCQNAASALHLGAAEALTTAGVQESMACKRNVGGSWLKLTRHIYPCGHVVAP